MKKLAVLLVDYIVIFGAIILSFMVLKNGVLLDYSDNIGAFYYVSPAIVVMYIVLAYVFGMYNLRRQSVGEVVYTVFIVSVALTICIMAACFFIRESATSYPRSVILLSAMLYLPGLMLWRTILRNLYFKMHGNIKVMIVGSQTQLLEQRLSEKFNKLYQIQFVCKENDPELMQKAVLVEHVFVAEDVSPEVREKIFLLPVEHQQISVFFVPKINDIGVLHARLQNFDDIPTYVFSKMFLTHEERWVKRLIDMLISVALLILFSPVFLILPFIIMMDGGPVFYRQERLTRGHKIFRIIKFRTMIPDAETQSGPVLSDKNDHRITAVGRFLRAARFDELPQLFNVLSGTMSLVGPRPERPFFTEQIEQEIPEFKYRLNVKAGLTGLAQVNGKYNTGFRQKLQYDLYYINNYSIFKDGLIMLRTIKILFQKDKTEGVLHDESIAESVKYSR